MGNTLESIGFETAQVEIIVNNIDRLCHLVRSKFPDYVEAKYLRMWAPRYVVDLIVLYTNQRYTTKQFVNEEGAELFGFPLYYNSVDEITVGVLDFHFFKENTPRITMTNFMTDKPIFK